MIFEETEMAVININMENILSIFIWQQMKKICHKAIGKTKKKVQVETLDDVIEIEMGTLAENGEENYYALWKYKDAYYQLSGQIEKGGIGENYK